MSNVPPRIGFLSPLDVVPQGDISSVELGQAAPDGAVVPEGSAIPHAGKSPVVTPAQEHFTTFKFDPDDPHSPDMRVVLSMPAFKASPDPLHPVDQAQLAAVVQDVAWGNIPKDDANIVPGKRDFTLKEITGYSINLKTMAITFYGTKVGTNWYGGEKKTHYKVQCNLVDDSKLSAAGRVDLTKTLTASMEEAVGRSGYNLEAVSQKDALAVGKANDSLYSFRSWQDPAGIQGLSQEKLDHYLELRSHHKEDHALDQNSWMDHPMEPFDRRWLSPSLPEVDRERGKGEAVVPKSRGTLILQILLKSRSVADLLKVPYQDPLDPANEQIKQNGIVNFVSHKWPQPSTVEAAPPVAGRAGSNPLGAQSGEIRP